jgi:hypothetical protein
MCPGCGSHTMAVQEHYDLAEDLLLSPCSRDAIGTHRPYAGHLTQALWFCFNRVEDLLAERPDQLLGVDGANATDHPGALR